MLYAYRVLGALGHVTKILQAENMQKVDEFEPIYLINDRYWWKMVNDFWMVFENEKFLKMVNDSVYQPPFFWLCSCTQWT